MKALILLTCLLVSFSARGAEEVSTSQARRREPEGGLVEVLLSPAELGLEPTERIRLRLLLDPRARPSLYFPSKDDLPGTPYVVPDPKDPTLQYRRERDRVGAEAVAYLAYYFREGWYYVKILRFPTAKEAEGHWETRLQESKSHLIGSPAGNLVFTPAGQPLRSGVKARMETVECRYDRYVVRMSPARPGRVHDPSLELLSKQMEKIRTKGELAAGGNAE